MTPQHQEQAYATALHQLAKAARKCSRAEVRQLWNPHRPWSVNKYGGRIADKESLQCRQDTLNSLAKFGPLTNGEIRTLLSGYGKRRCQNAMSHLISTGKVVSCRKDDSRFRVFALPTECEK